MSAALLATTVQSEPRAERDPNRANKSIFFKFVPQAGYATHRKVNKQVPQAGYATNHKSNAIYPKAPL